MLPKHACGECLGTHGVFPEPVVYFGDLRVEPWCIFGKSFQDPNGQFEIRRDAPLFLLERGDGDSVAIAVRVEGGHQAVVGES